MHEFHYKYIKKNLVQIFVKIFFVLNLIHCLQKQIVQFLKLKQMMFMKIFMKIEICLVLVVIQEIQSFLILLKRTSYW